jgi:DNA-binding NtrC family response regulator
VLGPQAPPAAGPARGGPAAVEQHGTAEAAADPGSTLLRLRYHEAKEAWIERFERAYVEHALARADGNLSQAARDAGVDRRHLQRLMNRYDIRKGRA